MFFRAVTTPLMTPVPNFNKWCAVSNFLFKNIDFCIFTPKTPLVKENYFLTLWNFTYLKDTSFGKKLCNFELGLETKNEFEKWPLYNFVSVYRLRKFTVKIQTLFQDIPSERRYADTNRISTRENMITLLSGWREGGT